MENTKYTALTEHLKNILKTAKKLGLNVQPCGGYSMGYSINNLPPYPVGLFGALSIVDGPGGRCKLGLTFDETESLEAGFNGNFPDARNKTKKKRRNFKPDAELMKIGGELATNYANRPTRNRYSSVFSNDWDNPYAGGPGGAVGVAGGAMPAYLQAGAGGLVGGQGGMANQKKKKKAGQALQMEVQMIEQVAGIPVKYAQAAPISPQQALEDKKKLVQEFIANAANKELLDKLVSFDEFKAPGKIDEILFKVAGNGDFGMDLQPENSWKHMIQDFDEPIVWKDVEHNPDQLKAPGEAIAAEHGKWINSDLLGDGDL